MKKIIQTSYGKFACAEPIDIGSHSLVGVQRCDFGTKYIPVQVEGGFHQLIAFENTCPPNRYNGHKFAGTRDLAVHELSEGNAVFVFDNGKEMIEWWMS